MDEIELWHNPRCTTSRNALSMLRERGVEPKVVEYLKTPPDAKRLEQVLKALKKSPREIMRKKEAVYAELDLDDTKKTDAQLVRAMAEHPILIERPIAIRRKRAVLGRPAEKVLEILES
jgi:arsenate reductase (glutaredoxin)